MSDKKPYKIYVEHDATVLRVYPALAREIGLNESMMLLQIDFWVSISTALENDGHPWTYQSVSEMREKAFPFWSRDTINRIVNSLIKKGLVVVGNYNQKKYDKTRWLRLDYEQLGELSSIKVGSDSLSDSRTGSTQNRTRSTQNRTTIPEIITDTSSDTKNGASTPEHVLKFWTYWISLPNRAIPREEPTKTELKQLAATMNVVEHRRLAYCAKAMAHDKRYAIPENQVRLGRLIDPKKREGNIATYSAGYAVFHVKQKAELDLTEADRRRIKDKQQAGQ